MSVLHIIARLKQQLLTSGLQKRDNPLYQVIYQLIGYLESVGNEANTAITIVDTSLKNATYITSTDQTAILPNSRVLTAGTDIAIDNTVAGISTINSTGGGGEWYPLSNGNVLNPEIIFANGAVIMVHVP